MAQPNRINHEPIFLLASAPWRESSLWVEAFSRRYGRVALLARSARKRQSELRGVLVPFVPVSASWYGSQELKTLHRAEWIGGWTQPQGRALFSGLYVNELML
ncbi:recombination protein O N-terminal domain-containing protein, partial [uncultured Neisseria sp.]